MVFTDENVKELVESFLPFLKRIIKQETSDCVRINMAKVISVDEDAGTCTIRFANGSSLGTDDIAVCNKYGIELEAGDFVNIQYWNNSTEMYIASRSNGSSELSSYKPIEKTNIPLLRSAWGGALTCTITVSDAKLTTDSIVFVSPTSASFSNWIDYKIKCVASGSNSLTFECDELPPDVTFNIVVWNV